MDDKPDLQSLKNNIVILGSLMHREVFEIVKYTSINDGEIENVNSLLNLMIFNHRQLLDYIDKKLIDELNK